VLGEARYLEAAERAAAFALAHLRKGGRLQRSWRGGRTSGPGFLEDQAFLVQGLLHLHEASLEARWLREAVALAEETEALFADGEVGGWTRRAGDQEALFADEKPSHDGAEPSGASVALLNALRLEALTSDDRWRRVAERALRLSAPLLSAQPVAFHEMLLAIDFFADSPRQVVLVWPEGEEPPGPFLEVLRHTFLPSGVLTGGSEVGLEALSGLAPVAREKRSLGGAPTAYVCDRGRCLAPARSAAEFRAQLGAAASPP